MALSFKSTTKAREILTEINEEAGKHSFIKEFKNDGEIVFDRILGAGEKDDGGWENVFINLRDPSMFQLNTFFERKNEIGNTAFVRAVAPNVIRLGWF